MSFMCRYPHVNRLQGMEMYSRVMGSMPKVPWSDSNDVGGRMLSVVGVSVVRIRRMKTCRVIWTNDSSPGKERKIFVHEIEITLDL